MKHSFFSVFFLSVVVLFMTGCATSSQITRFNESNKYFKNGPSISSNNYPSSEIYTLYERGAHSLVSISELRSNLERRAQEFAYRQNKSFVILGEKKSEPPYILGNFPRIQIVFALIDKKK